SDRPDMFSQGPVIDPTGNLSFTPAPNAFGTATVTVVLTDSGGTANGGRNASNPQKFFIVVVGVNDAPGFLRRPDVSAPQDAPVTFVNWATGIVNGPPNEANQGHAFIVTNDNPTLFAVPPAIGVDGTLVFQPSGSRGTAVVTVRLQDNGGTANGGIDV